MGVKWIGNEDAMQLARDRGDTDAARGGMLDYIAAVVVELKPKDEAAALRALFIEVLSTLDLDNIWKLRETLMGHNMEVSELRANCNRWVDAWEKVKLRT